MIIWFLLILLFTQVTVGQELPQARYSEQIFRTAPVVIPCRECVQNSRMSLGSLVIPPGCGCGCGGMQYQDEDYGPSPPSVQLETTADTGDGPDWCSCCTDDNPSNDGPAPFSVAMLAPLASVLTSFMRGMGNNGNDAVTVSFDGQTCSSEPSEEYPSGGPQCEVPPYSAESNNHSASYLPSPPLAPTASGPVIYNTYPPRRVPVAANKHPGGCQCKRTPRKGVSDIEEDSIYAFAQNNPEKRCSCNSHLNRATAFNRAFPRNRNPPENSFNQQHLQMYSNDIHQQIVQKDNFISPPPTGNPEFDSISRLSALISSQKNNLNEQTSNHEQNMMPCQCCC